MEHGERGGINSKARVILDALKNSAAKNDYGVKIGCFIIRNAADAEGEVRNPPIFDIRRNKNKNSRLFNVPVGEARRRLKDRLEGNSEEVALIDEGGQQIAALTQKRRGGWFFQKKEEEQKNN